MAGLVLYAGAGLAAALVPDVHSLIIARLLQALGGCAGLVIGRAIVRDTALPQEAARRMAVMNLMVAVGPGAAPLIGGGAGLEPRLAIDLLRTGAARHREPAVQLAAAAREQRRAAKPANGNSLARNYGRLLVSPAFLGYAVGGGCATTSMYAFIGASPFIFAHQLHRPDYEVGIYPAIVLAGVWIGSVAATRLIPILPIDSARGVGQSAERGGLVRPAGRPPRRPSQRGDDHGADVRVRHGRGRRVACGDDPGDQRQPGGHRLGLRALRLLRRWAWVRSARRWSAWAATPR